jgi:hypothetical protein
VVALVLVGQAAWRTRRQPAGEGTSRLQDGVLLMILITSAGGLGLLVGGARPREALHLVYSVIALGALPIAHAMSTNWAPRRRALVYLVGAVITLAVVGRLLQTG